MYLVTAALLLTACEQQPMDLPSAARTTTVTNTTSTTTTDVNTPSQTGDTGQTTTPATAVFPAALSGVNLLENPGGELGDMTGWDILEAGGDGWATTDSPGHAHGGTYEFRTSYGFARREQRIDLVAAGFSEAVLDAQPIINASEWFSERCTTGDEYSFVVRLLDANGAEIAVYSDSGVTANTASGCDYTDDAWFELFTTFQAYGPGLRTIVFEDGGRDSEYWAGYFGIGMDDANLSLESW